MNQHQPLHIITDSREQHPYLFRRYDCVLHRAKLDTGDYSLLDHESAVAVERKELNDMVNCCMGQNRDRFERELARLKAFQTKAVVIEAGIEEVAKGYYLSKMKPHAVLQSILTFQVRYGVPFVWAGSRNAAEYVTFWMLQKYQRELALAARAA